MSWAFYGPDGSVRGTQAPSVQYGLLEVILDGLGSVIQTGVALDLPVNFSGVWVGWRIVTRATGSLVVDVWNATSYPTDAGDTIIGGGGSKPTLVGAGDASSDDLTGWDTTFAAGDILTFNVDSASGVTRATLALKYRRV
jgi:hypothetical protein